MKLQILGTGCPKCKNLTELTDATAQELGLDSDLEKVTDINAIMQMDVMMTPALAAEYSMKVVQEAIVHGRSKATINTDHIIATAHRLRESIKKSKQAQK